MSHVTSTRGARDVHVLHETLHVSSTEQLGDERLGREALEIVEVLSRSEEDDRSLGRSDAESTTETGWRSAWSPLRR